MNKNECLRLISLYGCNNWLWDARDPNYTNKGMREDSWLNISREMQKPIPELKNKMNSLLGSYRREKSREKKSMITGSGRDEVYRSTWYAYDSFSFLTDRYDPGSTRETIDNDETNTTNEDHTVRAHSPAPSIEGEEDNNRQQTQGPDNGTENSQTCSNGGPNSQVSKKRSKKRKHFDDDVTINDAYKLLQQCANTANESQTSQSDTYSAFGQYIANELRKYDPTTLAHVKNDICGIIFQADTGAYQQYRYSNESYDYARPSSSSSYYYSPIQTPSPLPPQSPLLPPPPPPPPVTVSRPSPTRPPPLPREGKPLINSPPETT